MKNLVAYVAVPYRASTETDLVRNIRRAEAYAKILWEAGIPTICPHKNTALFGGICHDEHWEEGYLVILRRCDLLVVVTDWEMSKGTTAEIALAHDLNIPVFYSLADAVAFVESKKQH